ncbi:hypothetical protein GCM10008941_01480 [Rhizomicrobium palustre]
MHAVEKVRPRADFDSKHDDRREPPAWICTPIERRKSSQSGTQDSDPFWDGPRLTPQFVAQVMGQVYCPHTAPDSAVIYRQPRTPLPLFLDKKI